MSWASKTFKKAKKWVTKHNKEILGTAAFLGGGLPGGLTYLAGNELKDAMDAPAEAAEEAAREQERANAEAKAIAERKGVEATADNTAEMTAESEQRKKRMGYLSTIKTRGSGSLLAAASAAGYKRNLGD
uniref:Uncharacterized protein n=1 Tax=uncultured Elusimicrobia bacterium TaxID=699876 RepID=A0A650ELF8_9BACT|nr:hypothetical protein Elusimicrob1349_1170 [uncultured Elusimicrobia bacterium]